jgi:hypothetical protein
MRVKTPPPDPNVGIAAKGQADIAAAAEARAAENDRYYRENFAPRYLQQMDDQISMGRELNNFNMGLARKYDNRYWDTTAKFQDDVYAYARNFDTEGARTRLAGQAGADVERQSAAALGEMQRNMGRAGINPNDGATLSMMRSNAMDTALAKAGAMNMARDAARREGLNLRSVAAGMGGNLTGASAGFASGAAGSAQLGMAGIQGAQGGMNANNGAWGNTMGVAGNAFGQMGQLGMGLTQMQYDANKSNAAGANALIGKGVGFALGKWG